MTDYMPRTYTQKVAPSVVARALTDATPPLLMPDPQIIRTVEELEALDPDTVVERRGTIFRTARNAINVAGHWGIDAVLPAVVIREGAEVRAARKALWEA